MQRQPNKANLHVVCANMPYNVFGELLFSISLDLKIKLSLSQMYGMKVLRISTAASSFVSADQQYIGLQTLLSEVVIS